MIPGQGIKIPQACSRAKKKEREKEAYIGISACELVEVGVVVVRANLERSSGLVVSLTPPFTTREAKNPTKGRMCLSAQGKLVPCWGWNPERLPADPRGPMLPPPPGREDAPPTTAMLIEGVVYFSQQI